MVLMCVFAIMSKNYIGRNGSLHFFKYALNLRTNEGHKRIFEVFQDGTLQAIRRDERTGTAPCLTFSRANRAQHNPVKLGAGIELSKAQNRAATANLNIIRVASDAENIQRPGRIFVKSDVNHSAFSLPYFRVASDSRNA